MVHSAATLSPLTLDNGLHMHVTTAGSGPRTALFLHGFPELSYSWRHQLAAVPDGFRFVAPDMRGYGETDAPKGVRAYTMDKLVSDVTGLARALGEERVDIVGHDWGGAIAWEVARRHPQLVRTLTVMNCPPPEMLVKEMRRNLQQLRMSWYMFFFQLPLLPELFFMHDTETLLLKSARSVARNKEPFTRASMQPYVANIRKNGPRGLNYYRASLLSLFDKRRPPKITAPTRLIWGMGDGALGPWFANESRYVRVAEQLDIVRIESAGHWVQQEAPEQVNAALFEHLRRH